MSKSARPRSNGRRGTRLKAKEQKARPAGWAKELFEESLGSLLSEGEGSMMEFRVCRTEEVKPETAPTTYTPNINATKKKPSGQSFGKQDRFLSSKLAFISSHHQSDLLCSVSPGPKYFPAGFPTKPRAPRVFWASIPENADRREREQLASFDASADVGPAAYAPRRSAVLPLAPRYRFGPSYDESKRIRSAVAETKRTRDIVESAFWDSQPLSNRKTDKSQWKQTKSKAPKYTFAPKTHRPIPKSARSSFINSDHRGVKKEDATRRIAPDSYSPKHQTTQPSTVRQKFKKSMRFGMSEESREFISTEHCKVNYGILSPGPVVHSSRLGDMGYAPNSARSTRMKWIP